MVEFCAESCCEWVTHTLIKSFHKYMRVARGQDEVEVKSMIDMVLVKKDMLHYELDEGTQMRVLLYCVKSGY